MKSLSGFLFKQKESHHKTLEERKKSLKYFILLLFMICLVLFSIFNFVWLNKNVDENIVKKQESESKIDKKQNKVDLLNLKLEKYQVYQDEASRLVALAESVGESPIFEIRKEKTLDSEIPIPEYPPNVIIKAVVVMDIGKVAVLDIDGEMPGKVCRIGTVFGNGKGKITEIDSKGVSWTWQSTKHRTNL